MKTQSSGPAALKTETPGGSCRHAPHSPLVALTLVCHLLAAFNAAKGEALPSATVRGRVTDQTGGAAVGLLVILRAQSEMQRLYHGRTDAFGDFRISGLPPGRYRLFVELDGFQPVVREIELAPGATHTEDVVLELATQSATVVVRADAAATLMRTESPILELPQSIQLIDEKVLDQQQVVRLENIFRNVSGVNQFSAYQDFNIRGFRSGDQSVLYNGSRAGMYTFWTSPMLTNIDRVEVLKGPAGVLYGAGEPGGLINLVTKKPQPTFHHQLNYAFGQFDHHRSQLDTTGPANPRRTLLYRFNGAYFNNRSFRWFNRFENYLLAPSISWAPSSRWRLTLEAEAMKDNRKAQRDRGILAPQDNVDLLPVGFTVQEPGDFQNNSGDALQLHYIHSFRETWTFTTNARHARNRYRDFYHEPRTFTADFTAITRQHRDFNRRAVRKWINSYASGPWRTGHVRHSLTMGFDLGFQGDDVRSDRVANPGDGVPPLHLYRLNYGQATPSLYRYSTRSSADADSRQYALYVRDQLQVSSSLRLMAAVRWTAFKDWEVNFNEITRILTTRTFGDRDFSTQAGAVWLPTAATSLYFGFAESFLPQGASTISRGGPFDPERGRQVEAGLKREWLRSRLSSTLAFFRIRKQNVLVVDPASPFAFLTPIGEITSRGLEFDLAGKFTDRLNLTANYAYLDAKVTRDTDPLRLGRRNENAPRNSANIWVYYQFPVWNLSAGAGTSYVSRRPTFGTLVIPDYWITNATLSWTRGPIKFTGTVDNLANRRYFIGGYSAITLFPGCPRMWLISATMSF